MKSVIKKILITLGVMAGTITPVGLFAYLDTYYPDIAALVAYFVMVAIIFGFFFAGVYYELFVKEVNGDTKR